MSGDERDREQEEEEEWERVEEESEMRTLKILSFWDLLLTGVITKLGRVHYKDTFVYVVAPLQKAKEFHNATLFHFIFLYDSTIHSTTNLLLKVSSLTHSQNDELERIKLETREHVTC